MSRSDWRPEENRVLREHWPRYGVARVYQELDARGFFRNVPAIRAHAWALGLERAPWDPAEEQILRDGIQQCMSVPEISEALADAGWDRERREVGAHARELGLWEKRPRLRQRTLDGWRLKEGQYRPLTPSTVELIRLWHSRGDSMEYLAEDMQRPLWFVKAVINGEPWQERWEREKERAA